MQIISASAVIEDATPDALRRIEIVGRTCYKSEDRIAPGSDDKFVRMIRDKGHLAMFDHVHVSVRFVVDRGVSHEIVRHRVGVGYAQESTRYCNYSKDKFGSGVTYIRPNFLNFDSTDPKMQRRCARWLRAMEAAEQTYLEDLADDAKPQEARGYLPHFVKTEIVVTGSFTYWRHFFKQRTDPAAHPQMREVTVPLLAEFIQRWPAAFDDFKS